jgi:hypothetical protein
MGPLLCCHVGDAWRERMRPIAPRISRPINSVFLSLFYSPVGSSFKHTGVAFKSCFLASLEEHSICIVGLNFISLINVLLVTGESNLSFEMLLRFDGDTVCRVMSS